MEKEIMDLTNQIQTGIDGLKKSLDGKADGGKVEALAKQLENVGQMVEKLSTIEGKGMGDYVANMQNQLNAIEGELKEQRERKGVREKSTRENLREMLNSAEYKAACKEPRVKEFNVKAGDITTGGDFSSGTGTIVIPGDRDPLVGKQPWRPLPIWDNISKGVIGPGKGYVDYVERTNAFGGATTAEGSGAFGQSSGSWASAKATVYKLGAYIKASRESLEDVDFIESEIMDLLNNELPQLRESKLLTGSGSSDIQGLISSGTPLAQAFAKPSGLAAVAKANEFDVLRAAILQVQIGDGGTYTAGFQPNLILLHPSDAANMELVKDDNGQYVLPPFTASNGMVVKGVPVATSLYQTAGTFLVGDFSRAKAYVKRNLEIRMWDQNSTDPIYDLVTFTASMRLAFLVKALDQYAFVYGTFTTGKSLIAV